MKKTLPMRAMMALAAATFATAALAQSLAHGIEIKDMKADRNTATGETLITATLQNDSGKYVSKGTATFTLQDAQGNVIGKAVAPFNDIPMKESRPISATTSLPFARFTAYDISVQ
jgi:hydrogenase/urease accessory protein HupE